MKALQVYTACIVQPICKFVYKRKEIRENLIRYLQLIDTVGARFGGWAPLKLVAFPEDFLQGFTARASIEDYKREILIMLPGEETDQLGERARKYGIQ